MALQRPSSLTDAFLERLVARVPFPVHDSGRHVDEVAGSGLDG